MKLKGIDGDPHKRWSMWFNSTQREEPYQRLTSYERCRDAPVPLRGNVVTGGAWLSSARVVRCWVKSRNERNPYRMLPRSEEHTSELQSRQYLVCRLLLEKKKKKQLN